MFHHIHVSIHLISGDDFPAISGRHFEFARSRTLSTLRIPSEMNSMTPKTYKTTYYTSIYFTLGLNFSVPANFGRHFGFWAPQSCAPRFERWGAAKIFTRVPSTRNRRQTLFPGNRSRVWENAPYYKEYM